jgi:hypothetical protein
MKRPWRSRLIEFALWAALSLGVALALILLSDRILAPNF